MATSIDDLLTAIHEASANVASIDPRDASRALDYSARLLTRLREDGFGDEATAARDGTVRRLADACRQASIAFGSAPGRVSELVGVTGDAAGRLREELSSADRWTIAIRTAIPARRCAAVIATSGPYTQVPQLLSVADRSRELLHVAATNPPEPDELRGHDLLIPSPNETGGLSPTRAVLEQIAALHAELRRRDRDPLTVRELLAVCHVAGRVAGFAEQAAAGPHGLDIPGGPMTAVSWRAARDTVGMYTDGIRPTGRSSVFVNAARLDTVVRRANARMAESASITAENSSARADLMMIQRLLEQAARICSAEMMRTRPSLFVQPGPTPLHEERVGEWLRRQTFTVTSPDLKPALESLQTAQEASASLRRHIWAPEAGDATTAPTMGSAELSV